MAQTSFDGQDAELLLRELEQFHDVLRSEWSRVLNQWSNLQLVWRDEQFDKFSPIFEKLVSVYNDAEQANENYINFVQQQIDINADKKQKLASRLKEL
ncbi:MAG: hypothetical protein F6K31_33165 [Symploca sp. SIO2G7]|nr:hypothetical protein [Symploca sp. SIO2G7]